MSDGPTDLYARTVCFAAMKPFMGQRRVAWFPATWRDITGLVSGRMGVHRATVLPNAHGCYPRPERSYRPSRVVDLRSERVGRWIGEYVPAIFPNLTVVAGAIPRVRTGVPARLLKAAVRRRHWWVDGHDDDHAWILAPSDRVVLEAVKMSMERVSGGVAPDGVSKAVWARLLRAVGTNGVSVVWHPAEPGRAAGWEVGRGVVIPLNPDLPKPRGRLVWIDAKGTTRR